MRSKTIGNIMLRTRLARKIDFANYYDLVKVSDCLSNL